LKQAQVAEIDVVSCGKQGLSYVIDVLKVLIAQEREILSSASQAGDEVTVSMMSDYLKEQEKLAWMLAAWSTQHE
ncbi:ferritin-like domain-containing protein, partial [Sodaliphilus pleomorphus]